MFSLLLSSLSLSLLSSVIASPHPLPESRPEAHIIIPPSEAESFTHVSSSPSAENEKRFTGTKYLFTFGDSYTQTGFSISGTHASASNPLGNPAFPGYTTDNGANWVGYLVQNYNTSLTLSYNFASGGATVSASLVAPYESTVLSLIDQVSLFTSNKGSISGWTASNSLVGVWIGVNDVGNSYGGSGETALLGKIIDAYFGQLSLLYGAGLRQFVLLGVPPINKTPLMLAQSSTAQSLEASVITQFNTLLNSSAASFQSQNSGSTVTVYDTALAFNAALSNPTSYGASSNGATCYNSDGVSCLWWNNYHPGQAIQKLVAQGVKGVEAGGFF